MFLRDFIRRCAEKLPDKAAFIDADQRRSWREMHERSDRLARAMQDLGLAAGDKTAILSHNRIEIAEHWFACLKSGIVRAGLNWRYSPREMLHVIRDCDARLIFIEANCQDSLRDHFDELAAEGRVLIGFGGGHDLPLDFDRLIAGAEAAPDLPALADDALGMIGYTSGTTGKPKGVLLSQKNLITSLVYNSLVNGYTRHDVRIYVTNPAGININSMCLNLVTGMTTVLENFQAERFLDLIEQHKATSVTLVPTMLRRIIDDINAGHWNVSSLRQVCYGTMPATPALIRDAYNTLGCGFLNRYGVSETTGAIAYLDDEDHKEALAGNPDLLMSTGLAMPHVDIEIRDEDGMEVPPGTIGTVWVRSETVMRGYLNLPSETADALRLPWLKTGDFGRKDDRGYIYLGDRKHSMIVTGGFNVYPNGVENTLAEHPAVSEVAVIGVPHPQWGEAVVAAVSLTKGASATAAEIVDWSRDKLSKFEIPKHIEILSELPRGNTDKVAKLEILKMVKASPSLPWDAGK